MGNIMAILLKSADLSIHHSGRCFARELAARRLRELNLDSSMAMRRFRGKSPAHAAIMASDSIGWHLHLQGVCGYQATWSERWNVILLFPAIKEWRTFRRRLQEGLRQQHLQVGRSCPRLWVRLATCVTQPISMTAFRHYLTIIIAAIVPALAYYLSLFVTVIFEARALNMSASDAEDLEPIVIQDWINLVLVVLPIATVVFALVSGFSAAGSAMLAHHAAYGSEFY